MAEKIGSVFYKLEIDTKGFDQSLKKAKEQLKDTGGSAKDADEKVSLLSGSFSKFAKGAAIGAAAAGVALLAANLKGAIARVDTLNNAPKVLDNLGFSAEESAASVDRIANSLKGLPSRLDDVVRNQVALASSTDFGLEKVTDLTLAFNNMALAGGQGAEAAQRAFVQFNQGLGRGRFNAQDFNTLLEVMPGQLKQVAQALLGPTANAVSLKNAISKGTISNEQFVDSIIRLNREGGDGFASFEKQAKDATKGIQTGLDNVGAAIQRALASVLQSIGSEEISGFLTAFGAGFEKALKVLVPVVELLKGLFEVLKPIAVVLGGALFLAFELIKDSLQSLVNVFNSLKPTLKVISFLIAVVLAPVFASIAVVIKAVTLATNLLAIAINVLLTPLKVAFSFFSNLFDAIKDTSAFKSFMNAILTVGRGVEKFVTGIRDAVVGFVNLVITLINKIPFVEIDKIGEGGEKTEGEEATEDIGDIEIGVEVDDSQLTALPETAAAVGEEAGENLTSRMIEEFAELPAQTKDILKEIGVIGEDDFIIEIGVQLREFGRELSLSDQILDQLGSPEVTETIGAFAQEQAFKYTKNFENALIANTDKNKEQIQAFIAEYTDIKVPAGKNAEEAALFIEDTLRTGLQAAGLSDPEVIDAIVAANPQLIEATGKMSDEVATQFTARLRSVLGDDVPDSVINAIVQDEELLKEIFGEAGNTYGLTLANKFDSQLKLLPILEDEISRMAKQGAEQTEFTAIELESALRQTLAERIENNKPFETALLDDIKRGGISGEVEGGLIGSAIVTATANRAAEELKKDKTLETSLQQNINESTTAVQASARQGGANIANSVGEGIQSQEAQVASQAESFMSKIRNFFPFSPAKVGPFSGKGWTLYSGIAIAEALATGINKTENKVQRAISDLIGNAQGSLSTGALELGNNLGGGDIGINTTGARLLAGDVSNIAGSNKTIIVAATVPGMTFSQEDLRVFADKLDLAQSDNSGAIL